MNRTNGLIHLSLFALVLSEEKDASVQPIRYSIRPPWLPVISTNPQSVSLVRCSISSSDVLWSAIAYRVSANGGTYQYSHWAEPPSIWSGTV